METSDDRVVPSSNEKSCACGSLIPHTAIDKLKLGMEFSIQRLGELKFFLRIQMGHDMDEILLYQQKYLVSLLK